MLRRAVCVLMCFSAVMAARGDVELLLYNTLRANDATIVAAGMSTINAEGSVLWEYTKARGLGNRALSTAMELDRCFHMNSLAELLVVMAALTMQADSPYASTLDDTISTKYTPSNLTFTNPLNGFNVTYRELMQHTSSILDTNFMSFTTTSSTVGSLASFVSAYFVVDSSGVPALNRNVFSTNQPGLAASYAFARANTALLSFVLENVIGDKGLPFSGLDDYIAQTFLQPFGMSSTFFLRSAMFPGVTTIPSFSGVFPGGNFSNASFAARYFSGCVIDQMTASTTLHPAIYADFMGFTTMADLTRLIRGMFYPSLPTTASSLTLSNAVSLMMDSSISVTSSNARMAGQQRQGLGLMYFNGDTMCAAAKGTKVVDSCTVSNVSTVFGYVANRDFIETGFFCVDSDPSSTKQLTCVVATLLHTGSSVRSPTNLMAVAASTLQDLYGTFTVSAAPLTTATPAAVESEWFGVYCFLGVYLSIMGVYFSAQLIQWLFQPAALAQAADSGGAASLAYGAKVSPNRDATLVGDD